MTESENSNTIRPYKRTINQLGSLFKSRRETAYAALRYAPADQVRPLLLRCLTNDLKRTNRGWILKPVAIASALVAMNFLTDMAILHTKHYMLIHATSMERHALQHHNLSIVFGLFFCTSAGMIGTYAAAIVSYIGRYRRMWNAASLLALKAEQEAVGALTELVCRQAWGASIADVSNRNGLVKSAWIRMLTSVTGESASSFDGRQRRCLRSALSKLAAPGYKSDEQSHTAIAIMQCAAAIGDLDALPIVKRISEWQNNTANEQAVSTQARECLLALDLIREQVRTGAVLLRSSSDPGTQANVLLRGANESAEVDAAELLRADQIPMVEEPPVFVTKSYSVMPLSEEVLESKLGGG